MREQYEELLDKIMQKDYVNFEKTMDEIMKNKLIDKIDPLVQEIDKNIFNKVLHKGDNDV